MDILQELNYEIKEYRECVTVKFQDKSLSTISLEIKIYWKINKKVVGSNTR